MVGRHAQMIPTLSSTLDQIIEGVASSYHVSASHDRRAGTSTTQSSIADFILTRKIGKTDVCDSVSPSNTRGTSTIMSGRYEHTHHSQVRYP